MKKMKMIGFAAAVATAAISFAGCSNTTDNVDPTQESETSESVSEETQSVDAEFDVSGVDFSKPDVVINWGGYDEIKKLGDDISAGNMLDKVVEIEGYYSDNIRHSIMEYKDVEAKSAGLGYDFVVPEFSEEDYPLSESRIKLTGVVKEKGESYGIKLYTIVVPKDNFKVIKTPSE